MQSKKPWVIKSLAGNGKISLKPIFEVNEDNKNVETRYVELKAEDKTYTFNYLDLYMFFYFCSNEELRLKLVEAQQKKLYKIPYDVTFKLSKEERSEGMAKRRIELSIDEIAWYQAKQEALKIKFDKKIK